MPEQKKLAKIDVNKPGKLRTAILISGRGSNMQALVRAAQTDEYPAQISLVFSNNPEAAGLEFAQENQIPTRSLSHRAFKKRQEFDHAMDDLLRDYEIELICLAGFMRLLSPWFVRHWRDRILNIHPSLLPDFKGLHAQRQALEAGALEAGCSVHLVTEGMDEGPILGQMKLKIQDDEDEENLTNRILALEHQLYPKILADYAKNLIHSEKV